MTKTPNFEPNVTTEQGLRKLASVGHSIEVLCEVEPDRKGPSWYGTWTVRTVSPDGHERILVSARSQPSHKDFTARQFKTATGLISFLNGVGLSHANIPLKLGMRTTHCLPRE